MTWPTDLQANLVTAIDSAQGFAFQTIILLAQLLEKSKDARLSSWAIEKDCRKRETVTKPCLPQRRPTVRLPFSIYPAN